MVNIKIDEKEIKCDEGKTILEVANLEGIKIPTLCHHPAITPYGACRLCTVEIEDKRGRRRMVASCLYPVADGLKVWTNNERVRKARKIIIELLLSRCKDVKILKELAREYGIETPRFKLKDDNCILCGLCVRVCTEKLGIGAISYEGRGVTRKINIPFNEEFSPVCIGCGACTYVCPTGAIQMEAKTLQRFRTFDGEQRKCRYMMMGVVDYKLCPNNYECWHCEVDQRMEETYGMHPALAIKKEKRKEILVDEFFLVPEIFYSPGHLWIKRLNGKVRIGIDDFARKLLSEIKDLSFKERNSEIKKKDVLIKVFSGDKKTEMLSPVDGKIIDINPDVFFNPPIATRDPFGRGWLYTVEPYNLEEDMKKLLFGNKALQWLRNHSDRLHKRITEIGVTITDGGEIEPALHKRLNNEEWENLVKEFFFF
jgi:glycine cleavage system H lipoate-binding protein/ferredoxin